MERSEQGRRLKSVVRVLVPVVMGGLLAAACTSPDAPPQASNVTEVAPQAYPRGDCSETPNFTPHAKPINSLPHTYKVANARPGMVSDDVRSLLMDNTGLFIGFPGDLKDNVSLLKPDGFEVCGPDVNGHVNDMVRNPETQELFVATDGKGVHIWNNKKWLHFLQGKLEGLADHRTYCASVGEDEGTTLVCTLDGMSMWDTKFSKWFPRTDLRADGAPNQRFHTALVVEGSNGEKTAYAGMVGGGLVIKNATDTKLHRAEDPDPIIMSNSIRATKLSPDREEVCIANDVWVSCINLKTGAKSSVKPSGKEVLGLAYTQGRHLLAATYGGTYKRISEQDWKQINPLKANAVAVGGDDSPYDATTVFIGAADGGGLVQLKLP